MTAMHRDLITVCFSFQLPHMRVGVIMDASSQHEIQCADRISEATWVARVAAIGSKASDLGLRSIPGLCALLGW